MTLRMSAAQRPALDDTFRFFAPCRRFGRKCFRLWVSNYCTDRAMPLAVRYFESVSGSYTRLETGRVFARAAASVYKRHDCWTLGR